MDAARHLELIEAEYFKLQEIVEAFDAKALQFKGWSVTVTLAAAATALVTEKLTNDQRVTVLALAAFGSFAFWLTEAMWKLFQQAFFHRLRNIEAAFANDTVATLKPLQISSEWKKAFAHQKFGNFCKYALKPNTWLPHLAVSAFCLGTALYLAYCPLATPRTPPQTALAQAAQP